MEEEKRKKKKKKKEERRKEKGEERRRRRKKKTSETEIHRKERKVLFINDGLEIIPLSDNSLEILLKSVFKEILIDLDLAKGFLVH